MIWKLLGWNGRVTCEFVGLGGKAGGDEGGKMSIMVREIGEVSGKED